MEKHATWHVGAGSFDLDGIRFKYGSAKTSTEEQFLIDKPKSLVDEYAALARRIEPATIVELGIRAGGGTALLALLFRPQKLVAFELDAGPIPALDDFIESRQLQSVVRPYFGVDQSSKSRLDAIVADEFSNTPIDLVIDDASHLLDPTRASFEALFPRVRPGGLYVIEDWHVPFPMANKIARIAKDPSAPEFAEFRSRLGQAMEVGAPAEQPIARLVVQLLLARAISGDVVEEITVTADWVVVRRGPAALDPKTFLVTDHYVDPYGLTT